MIPAKAVTRIARDAQVGYDAWVSALGLDLRFAQHKRRLDAGYAKATRAVNRAYRLLSDGDAEGFHAQARHLTDLGVLTDTPVERHGLRGRTPRRRRGGNR